FCIFDSYLTSSAPTSCLSFISLLPVHTDIYTLSLHDALPIWTPPPPVTSIRRRSTHGARVLRPCTTSVCVRWRWPEPRLKAAYPACFNARIHSCLKLS